MLDFFLPVLYFKRKGGKERGFAESNSKKNYHFDLTGAFSNIIEESEAIEYDDDDDEDEFDDDDDD